MPFKTFVGNSCKENKNLSEVQYSVLRIISEPLCTARFYGAEELDTQCIELGKLTASRLNFSKKSVTGANSDPDHVVFVVSRLQKSGGHTRVIEDFVSLLPHDRKTIVVTEVPARSDRILEEKLQTLGAKVLWAPRGGLYKKLTWLQRALLSLNPSTVYLFNHHEDSVAVAAMSVLGDINKYFYHHADHHLCLGLYLDGFTHIDFHAFGYHRCRHDSSLTNNIYLPLTVTDHGEPLERDFLEGDGLLTCTAAGHNKLEVPYFIQYVDVIPRLLAETGGRHLHVGKLTWLARLKIKIGLKKYNVPSSRFIYIPWVPSVWETLLNHRVDLFIASFPVVGGRTLVEVMGAGVPVIVHDNPVSRFLGGVDMVYSGAPCWRKPEQLIDVCKNASPEKLKKQGEMARSHYLKYHHPNLLGRALKDGNRLSPPPLNSYISETSDYIEAVYFCDELSLSRWLSKFIYRTLKYWRSRWQCYF